MAKSIVEIELENREKLSRVISRGLKACTDLRVPFGLIARDQMRRQSQIFALKGPGKYQDLSTKPFLTRWRVKGRPDLSWKYFEEGYQQYKKERYGHVYPILFATGKLARSLIQPGGDNVLEIGKQSMIYGTNVDYGIYHQSEKPRRKLPRRPFLFVDKQRLVAWRNIINAHLKSALTGPR